MKRSILVAVVVITVAVLSGMVVSTIDRDKEDIVSDAVGISANAVNEGMTTTEGLFSNAFGYFGNIKELKEQAIILNSRIDVLESENMELEALKKENEELRMLLDLKTRTTSYPTVGATVTATDPNGWFSYLLIDKGTLDGLVVNNVVISPQGVVGYIDKIGTTWARVVSVYQPGLTCGATILRTGDTGIVEGDAILEGICKMTYIKKDASIVPGDYVQTSGRGDVYPEGLLIGRVKEVFGDDLSQTAIIEPAVDLDSIKNVLVITEVFNNISDTENGQ